MNRGGDDYCALEFYLDQLEVITPIVRKAFASIEPPLTPGKLKEALRRVIPEIYPRIVVERDPSDPNRLIVVHADRLNRVFGEDVHDD